MNEPILAKPPARRSPPRLPLRLPPPLTDRVRRLAVAGYPHEVCGLLLGRRTDGAVAVLGVTEARNRAVERLRDRYVLEPADYRAADDQARRHGIDVVGVWHTHPDHPARPSETDRAAAWPHLTYVILSVGPGGVGDVTAWELEDGRFVQHPVEEESI